MIFTETISSLRQRSIMQKQPTRSSWAIAQAWAVINDMIVGIENRDGNTNVHFNQRETLERIFKRLEASEIYISHARMDSGSCSEEIVDMIETHCRHVLNNYSDNYAYANLFKTDFG